MEHARGTFEVQIEPAEGDVSTFSLTKQWRGDLEGTGRGTMLSAGDPATGSAGYVALEIVEGTLGERGGTLAFVQLGLMRPDGAEQTYVVVPGSGTGELTGIEGTLTLDRSGGEHVYDLAYELSSSASSSST